VTARNKMLDIKLLRDNPEAVRAGLRRRGANDKLPLVDEAISLDDTWRKHKADVDQLRHRLNEVTASVAEAKRRGGSAEGQLKEAKEIPGQIKELEKLAGDESDRLGEVLMSFPNLLHESVPDGKDEDDNVVVRVWGAPRKFDFEPRHHVDLLAKMGMVDMERAAKISGARFSFLMGDAVKLEHAIMRFAIDFLSRRGFTPVEPPFMMSREAYAGVVDLNDFGPVIYKVEGEDLHMIATSEHPLVAMRMDEILEGSSLPLKYCGFSPCFRVEAGSHGKDTKGIFRSHQFYKVEQVVFSKPEDSWKLHEELIGNAEAMYRELGIHHRVVALCSADTGVMSAKTYDLEAWMPTQQKFREMASASNVTDFQARRLKIRFRDKTSEQTRLVHTLNSTGVVTRTLVAILENFQEKDGGVSIPGPLVPYMGGLERLSHQ
jgi:seryl-tRNA synthetase